MKRSNVLALLILSSVLSVPLAHAAKDLVVRAGEAKIYEQANRGSAEIETVARGTKLRVGNNPKGGFYKTKGPSGKIGYISATAFGGGGSKTPVDNGRTPRKARTASRASRSGVPTSSFAIFGGMTIGSQPSITATDFLPLSVLKFPLGFNARYQHRISDMFTAGVELDYFMASGSGLADDTTTTIEAKLSGLPVSVSIYYDDISGSPFYAGLAIGYFMSSTFTYSEISTSETLTDTVSSANLMFRGLVGFRMALSDTMTLNAEAGYQMAKGPELNTADSPADEQLSDTFPNGIPPFSIDWSGFLLRAGVQFLF
jgi:hypothetical protein